MGEGIHDRLAPHKVSMKSERKSCEKEGEFIPEEVLSVTLKFSLLLPGFGTNLQIFVFVLERMRRT